ncbi:hypothetical protein K1719_019351 [Acacia pycnantha]|nr:hypothetical protein K1719_019351 [Acacia pycnantha]
MCSTLLIVLPPSSTPFLRRHDWPKTTVRPPSSSIIAPSLPVGTAFFLYHCQLLPLKHHYQPSFSSPSADFIQRKPPQMAPPSNFMLLSSIFRSLSTLLRTYNHKYNICASVPKYPRSWTEMPFLKDSFRGGLDLA